MEILKNKKEWKQILKTHFQKLRDSYFEYEYFELFAKNFNVVPEALFWEDNNVKIFWSHLIRDIKSLDLFKDYNYYDLITPYGYGGPLLIKKKEKINDIKDSIKKFFISYKEYALEQNYICEFVRFHPLFRNWEYFKKEVDVKYLNDTVVLDLTQSLEDIYSDIDKKTRYYIRKALRDFEVVQIVKNPSKGEIGEFIDLYHKTMDKNQADEKYYFNRKFIIDHYKFDNLLITCRNHENVIGASAIFLKGTYIMHYHLSSTNYDFQYPPSRAILWKAIEWAKENGLKLFHFGGGVSKESLFHFKKGFSKTYLPFFTGNIIFNEKIYEELKKLNPNSKSNPTYFPSYRIGYEKTIV